MTTNLSNWKTCKRGCAPSASSGKPPRISSDFSGLPQKIRFFSAFSGEIRAEGFRATKSKALILPICPDFQRKFWLLKAFSAMPRNSPDFPGIPPSNLRVLAYFEQIRFIRAIFLFCVFSQLFCVCFPSFQPNCCISLSLSPGRHPLAEKVNFLKIWGIFAFTQTARSFFTCLISQASLLHSQSAKDKQTRSMASLKAARATLSRGRFSCRLADRLKGITGNFEKWLRKTFPRVDERICQILRAPRVVRSTEYINFHPRAKKTSESLGHWRG